MLLQKVPAEVALCVIGGGAAGFYAAISCAERAISNGHRKPDILIVEKSDKLLHKVSISGGGRCNVLHRHGVPEIQSYPRGTQLMEHLASRHGALDSARWFESKGVELKTEEDGRVFPASNTSKSIVDCFMSTATSLGIKVLLNANVLGVVPTEARFCLQIENTESKIRNEGKQEVHCKRLVICTGSAQKRSVQAILRDAGAQICPVVPSLFSLQFSSLAASKFRGLEGVAVPDAVVEMNREKTWHSSGLDAPNTCRRCPDIPQVRGPVLITHEGISGPAILRLSAWGAYAFKEVDYKAVLTINWAPYLTFDALVRSIMEVPGGRTNQPPVRRKAVGEVSPWPGVLPARLWQRLLQHAESNESKEFSSLRQLSIFKSPSCEAILRQRPPIPLREWPWRFFGKAEAAEALAKVMLPCVTQDEVGVAGRRVNKEEFVTAGGVNLSCLDWERMELRSQPGVHFAGETVDVDGITGGFNFQGCWSTGYAAGMAAADSLWPTH
eukprot:Skav236057  [mRNA]  locus=scaffold2566:100640:102133:+ [translate_table: standard]